MPKPSGGGKNGAKLDPVDAANAERQAAAESENPFESEVYKHSAQYPAFAGMVEFDLTFELFGQRVTRKARVDYKHTPSWEYYDLVKKAPYVGWGGTTWGLSLLTVPKDEDEEFDDEEEEEEGEEADDTDDFVEDDPPEPEWVDFNCMSNLGVLNRKIWDAIDEAIEADCKAEDVERRKAAAALQRKTERDVRRELGPPDRIVSPTRRLRSKAWKCSTCQVVVTSKRAIKSPAPCEKCGGIAFEDVEP